MVFVRYWIASIVWLCWSIRRLRSSLETVFVTWLDVFSISTSVSILRSWTIRSSSSCTSLVVLESSGVGPIGSWVGVVGVLVAVVGSLASTATTRAGS